MPKPIADEQGAAVLADLTANLLRGLPEGLTATVILCAGTPAGFTVATAGSTPPELLRLVLRTALERVEAGKAHRL